MADHHAKFLNFQKAVALPWFFGGSGLPDLFFGWGLPVGFSLSFDLPKYVLFLELSQKELSSKCLRRSRLVHPISSPWNLDTSWI